MADVRVYFDDNTICEFDGVESVVSFNGSNIIFYEDGTQTDYPLDFIVHVEYLDDDDDDDSECVYHATDLCYNY